MFQEFLKHKIQHIYQLIQLIILINQVIQVSKHQGFLWLFRIYLQQLNLIN